MNCCRGHDLQVDIDVKETASEKVISVGDKIDFDYFSNKYSVEWTSLTPEVFMPGLPLLAYVSSSVAYFLAKEVITNFH